jgi:hypothetical protein
MNEESLLLLREAVRLLRIVAGPEIRETKERFATTMLTSDRRRQMWLAMDGTKTLGEIGKAVGASGEAVRQFVRDVEQGFPDLIAANPDAGPQRPMRLL